MALVVKSLPANAGDLRDTGLIPGSGRYSGGGHGNPLQYFCLENPTDRGARWATVHRVTKSRTQLKGIGTCIHSRPTEGRIRPASSTDDSLRHFEAWYL